MLSCGRQEIGLVQFMKVVIATNYRMITVISTITIPIEHMRMRLSCVVYVCMTSVAKLLSHCPPVCLQNSIVANYEKENHFIQLGSWKLKIFKRWHMDD